MSFFAPVDVTSRKICDMSRYFFFGILALVLLWACSPVRETVKTSAVLTHDSLDSTEYDVVVIDPAFDQWYILNYSLALDHSNEYYRNQNIIAAGNWNEYYRMGRYPGIIACFLDYQPGIEYGIEVNRTLFWYFKYIKSQYGIRLY